MKGSETMKKVSEETYAYTPGLKVKRNMVVSKTRRLPLPGEVYVKVGDKVDTDTVVAKTDIRGEPEIVDVATLLDVEEEDLMLYMKKKVGDPVSKDEEIAGYSTLFGLIKKSVTSPIDGTIESISDITGHSFIRRPPVPVEINAYIPGTVVEVLPKEGVVIETNGVFVQAIFGVGGEAHGKVKMAVKSPDEELTAEHISSEDNGKVLIGGSLVTLEVLRKCVEVGISCIVTGGIRHKDMTTFMGEEIGVAITGHEEMGLTLLLTEGFGKMRMSKHTFDLLNSFEGYMASVNGATQIRAGVLRPEIIIPHQEPFEQISDDDLTVGMVPGTPIRIIRQPHFGAIGKVMSLPVELQQVETGSNVRVLEAELEDGRIVVIPRANVEIIEI